MNTSKSSDLRRDFLLKKMREKGISTFKELSEMIDIPYKTFRQLLHKNRLPNHSIDKLSSVLSTSENEMRQNGIDFADVTFRGSNSTLSKTYTKDILPIIIAVAKSGVKSCTLSEFNRLLNISRDLPSNPSDNLVKEILQNIQSK